MSATIEPIVAHAIGHVAAEERDHSTDVVAVDMGDHDDIEVDLLQSRFQKRPGVRRPAIDEHPPR